MDEVNEIEILFDIAVLGEQVDQFLKSDVGQFILARAGEEEEAGVEELKTLKCTDVDGIREAQNRVWRAASVREWLQEAIKDGLKAKSILESREE